MSRHRATSQDNALVIGIESRFFRTSDGGQWLVCHFAKFTSRFGRIAAKFTQDLLPPLPGLNVDRIDATRELVTVHASPTAPAVSWPLCCTASRRIHSRYFRTLADKPLVGRPSRLHVTVRRFVCGNVGYGIAYLIGLQLFPLFPRRVVIANNDLLQLAAIVLGISMLSSLLGIWKASRVKPNQALSG